MWEYAGTSTYLATRGTCIFMDEPRIHLSTWVCKELLIEKTVTR